MTKHTTAAISLIVMLLAVGAAGAWFYSAGRPATLTLRFEALTGGAPLILNEFVYANPGGAGTVKVRDFQFYLSNIRLAGASGDYIEPASYHLARFDNAERAFTLVLPDVPRRDYQRIEFTIGVDAAANRSIQTMGDLDANGRMAWNWESGYKFVLFEGGLMLDSVQIPLVYHVGFDESARRLEFDAGQPFRDTGSAQRVFVVDVMRLFDGAATIDMAALSNVKFDRADAKLLAGNFEFLIAPARDSD
jgi:hypothetical protein